MRGPVDIARLGPKISTPQKSREVGHPNTKGGFLDARVDHAALASERSTRIFGRNGMANMTSRVVAELTQTRL
jgi:hypothetical protein